MDGMMSDAMTAGMGLWMVLFLVTVVALLVLAARGHCPALPAVAHATG